MSWFEASGALTSSWPRESGYQLAFFDRERDVSHGAHIAEPFRHVFEFDAHAGELIVVS